MAPEVRDYAAFFRGFIRNPLRVASLVPSSTCLGKRIAEIANVAQARSVVEFGPGTGATTRQILRAMRSEATLLSIERDSEFAKLVAAHRDSRLTVHVGNAGDVAQAIAYYGLQRPQAIISGIPFSTLAPDDAAAIIRAIECMLAPNGVFVAYQLSAAVTEVAAPVFGRPETTWELRNLPPLRIFRWRVPARTSVAAAAGLVSDAPSARCATRRVQLADGSESSGSRAR